MVEFPATRSQNVPEVEIIQSDLQIVLDKSNIEILLGDAEKILSALKAEN